MILSHLLTYLALVHTLALLFLSRISTVYQALDELGNAVILKQYHLGRMNRDEMQLMLSEVRSGA